MPTFTDNDDDYQPDEASFNRITSFSYRPTTPVGPLKNAFTRTWPLLVLSLVSAATGAAAYHLFLLP